MIGKLFGRFSKDMGIDLGTANTLVYVKERGIVINEPSIVAVNTRTDQLIAVGEEARRMIGKTPGHIIATRPLVSGVISDFEITEKMLKHFIEKVHRETFTIVPRPRVVISIPTGVTEVETKAVEDAALSAGAREVFLVEEPMASAIGARIPVHDATGNMVVDIGGGVAEIAVISLGGIVAARTLRTAGQELDSNIIQYARETFNLLIGERTAEDVKIQIAAAMPQREEQTAKIRGRDLITGLPKEVVISSAQIREAIGRSLKNLIINIKATIEETPPELVADIYERGIVLSGGGALLTGLADLINQETGIPVHVADDPLTGVVRGTGIILEDLGTLKDILVLSPHRA